MLELAHTRRGIPVKKLLMITAVMALAVCSFAQSSKAWGVTGLYTIKNHSFQSTVLAPPLTTFDIGSLTANVPDVPHGSFVFNVGPFAGAAPDGGGLVGMYATHDFALTKDGKWNLQAGSLGYIANHRPFVTGFVVGLTVQLNGG